MRILNGSIDTRRSGFRTSWRRNGHFAARLGSGLVMAAVITSLLGGCPPPPPPPDEGQVSLDNQIQPLAGPRGEQGEKGEPGADGDTGDIGPAGPAGSAGPAGATGATGASGRDGSDGAQGPKGDPGEPGADGRDGRDGADGFDGSDGADGIDGSDGADGADGVDGRDGVTGAPGEPGPSDLVMWGYFQPNSRSTVLHKFGVGGPVRLLSATREAAGEYKLNLDVDHPADPTRIFPYSVMVTPQTLSSISAIYNFENVQGKLTIQVYTFDTTNRILFDTNFSVIVLGSPE